MIGFWIFITVLIICIAVVICVFLENADYSIAYSTRKDMRSIEEKLTNIEEMLKGGTDGQGVEIHSNEH